MSTIAIVLLLIISFFVILLALKKVLSSKLKVCVVCLAVSLTWILLLILKLSGYIEDLLAVAVLMGQSSLGVYYLIERRAPKRLLVFRLPVLLTLTMMVFTVVSMNWYLDAWLLILAVWLVIGFLYLYRTSVWAKDKIKALIECCSDW